MTTWTILPNVGPGPLRFGMTPAQVLVAAPVLVYRDSGLCGIDTDRHVGRVWSKLRYFLASSIQCADEVGAVSTSAVKGLPKRSNRHGNYAVFSDDKLMEPLQAKGFDIARRTGAKYREAIRQGSLAQRRRARALGRVG